MMLSTSMGIGGGAEEQIMHLAVALARRGWRVRLVSMLPPRTMPQRVTDQGIEVRTLGMRPGVPDPRAILRLRREIREFRPDVLHTHMTHGNLLGRVTRWFEQVPLLISTLHGLKMYGVTTKFTALREFGHRLTDSMCEVTTAICDAAAESYRASRIASDGKVIVLPNGVDTALYGPDPEARERMRGELGVQGKFVWLAVGRLEGIKNFPLMFRAFAQSSGEDSVLLICGSGSLRKDLEREAERAGTGGRVRFLGVRNDIPAVINASDAFILSSDTEGLPMVLLQASATGLPVACTDVGGNREVIVHGRTGLVTPAGDLPALAGAMRRIREMPARERMVMGMAGREHVIANYDLEAITGRWEALYRGLLPGGEPGTQTAANATSMRSPATSPRGW